MILDFNAFGRHKTKLINETYHNDKFLYFTESYILLENHIKSYKIILYSSFSYEKPVGLPKLKHLWRNEMKKLTKTEAATNELLKHDEISNRGHAFVILKKAGLAGSGAVFNRAIKAYEEVKNCELGKSASRDRADTKKENRARAHCWSAEDVKEHIRKIDKADEIFWACWEVFRHEGKWSKQLKTSDFAVHFNN